MQDIIERHRTLPQANLYMHKNQYISHLSVEEPEALLINVSEDSFVQRVYKSTAKITGSDPYWFQKRRKLTDQANQELSQVTLLLTFSSADNHCKPLV